MAIRSNYRSCVDFENKETIKSACFHTRNVNTQTMEATWHALVVKDGFLVKLPFIFVDFNNLSVSTTITTTTTTPILYLYVYNDINMMN